VRRWLASALEGATVALNPCLSDWQGRVVWVVGASSGIGLATAQALHAAGARVAVSARQAPALDAFVAAHPGNLALPLDVGDVQAVRQAAQAITKQWGPLDLVLYCAAHYQASHARAYDLADMLRHQQVNYVGALNLLDAVMGPMLAARRGHISLVGSVAGYRGLPQALAYGPTKAALAHLAEGLYLDLHGAGIGVSLISPGFVQTPLTAQNSFHMPALITPEQAAQAMLRGWAQGQFEIHFPKRFTRWMRLLRILPYPLYFALIRRILT
jgi:NAD(P)-dependent dehydrogenase (short-subunit alcohol dehydrogenase family)